jgi:hypothetical protein
LLTFKEPRNRFQGINSASLCSLAGRYDKPFPSWFLAPIDCLTIPAQEENRFLKDYPDQLTRCALVDGQSVVLPKTGLVINILNHKTNFNIPGSQLFIGWLNVA